MTYYGSKTDVVLFATALQLLSANVWPSITITHLVKYAVYSVSIVTDTLSEDTVAKLARTYSLQPIVTLQESIQAGLSLVR